MRLSSAVLLSLALHVVALGWRSVQPPIQGGEPNRAIQLRWAPVAPVSSDAVSVVEAPLSVKRKRSERIIALPRPQVSDFVVQTQVQPPEPAAKTETASAIEPRMPSAESARAPKSDDGAARKARQDMESRADGILQYRLALAREARKYRRYPGIARANGWEGDVTVVVTTVSGMPVPVASISTSSGRPVLDRAGLEMIGAALRDVPVPEILRGKEFAVTVPIRFSLDEN